MFGFAYALLAAGWVVWVLPFFLVRKKPQTPQKTNPRARWGILLVGVSYAMLWQNSFWIRPLRLWQIAVEAFFLALASLFSWTGALALGRNWSIDASLNADHKLVRSGPYRVVRHPIYTSMLCLLLGTGFLVTPLWLLPFAAALFMIGTEIRVRTEEALLGAHFGEEFQDYRRSAPAYVPFLK
jgi:protein-S-isoprenylcysteine O-methyltransferase Ste14